MDAVELHLCLLIFVIASTEAVKRYDIHYQAKMEYGMTLEDVLHQFRRSEDYHKILERKKQDIYELFSDISFRTLEMHSFKLGERLKEEFDIVEPEVTEVVDETTTSSNSGKGNKVLRLRYNRRDGTGPAPAVFSDDSTEDAHFKKVRRVDQYNMLHSSLTAKERNKYRDMGFTVCGEVIHAIIEGMGGVPGRQFADGSTVAPDGKMRPTTEHSLNHVVTHKGSSEEDEGRHTTPGADIERRGTAL